MVVFVVWRLTKGRLGRAWAAIRQDELAALSQGIHVARYKMIAFVLSALLAGFAGGLEAHLNFFVDPANAVRRDARGAGADVRGARRQRQRARTGGRRAVPHVAAGDRSTAPTSIHVDVISGVFLIAVIVFRPQGIVGRGGLAIIRPRVVAAARPSVSAATPG